jgi:predicted RNA binding protein YcfA (HicA-like mRNA interferase family)
MSDWPASKARRVLAALERIGWRVQRHRGPHRLLTRSGRPHYEFAFHDRDEIGPRVLARIS